MMKFSECAKPLKQSGIRSASVKCSAIGGINLGQGVCDIPVESSIKQGAHDAIDHNKSVYSPYNGIRSLRYALADKIQKFNNITVSPDSQIMVSHGATGAFVCATMALFNPGDEVIVFEPFYGYHKNILQLNQVQVKAVPINLDDLSIDMEQLKAAIGPKTRGMIICTPNNPTGKVYSAAELKAISEIVTAHDLYVITDEIYEYITYPGYQHISFASLEGNFDRTVTISGFSKTYNMTGWRLGYASGPAPVIEKMSLIQDLLYVCPATPLQHAGLSALALEDEYYEQMAASYLTKRDHVCERLTQMGFKAPHLQGAYYIMTDISNLGFKDDIEACEFLLDKAKVAAVPGRSFYHDDSLGHHIIRICYALQEDKIDTALDQVAAALANR